MKLFVGLVISLVALSTTAYADMKFPAANDFNIPEYLKPYAKIRRSVATKTFEQGGTTYLVLAETHKDRITLYDEAYKHNIDDIILHEIGHVVHYRMYGNEGPELWANQFVISAKWTDNLEDLMTDMGNFWSICGGRK